jgi:hypothetical protein
MSAIVRLASQDDFFSRCSFLSFWFLHSSHRKIDLLQFVKASHKLSFICLPSSIVVLVVLKISTIIDISYFPCHKNQGNNEWQYSFGPQILPSLNTKDCQWAEFYPLIWKLILYGVCDQSSIYSFDKGFQPSAKYHQYVSPDYGVALMWVSNFLHMYWHKLIVFWPNHSCCTTVVLINTYMVSAPSP